MAAMNVFDLAQVDTRLAKVSHKEYAGPCPGCGGSDRFHVQPDRRDGGAWMCRNCWPAESKGWADGIEYLRQFRHMSFRAAREYLSGEVETAIERIEQIERRLERAQNAPKPGEPPGQAWQDYAASYAAQAERRLWLPEGRAALDYLLSRGLKLQTIDQAHIGYIEKQGIPYIVFPWYADGVYWCINHRDLRPEVPQKERYKALMGSAKGAALYAGDSLALRRYAFLVEGEIDALTIAQEAGDLVAVVGTGGHDCTQGVKWIGRLVRAGALFVAYDRDIRGERKAERWLDTYVNFWRWRPHVKDANHMLTAGFDVRIWVQSALDVASESEEEAATAQAVAPAPPVEIESLSERGQQITSERETAKEASAFLCSVCGVDLERPDQDGYYDEQGVAYCALHRPDAATIADKVYVEDGVCWRISLKPALTMQEHIHRLYPGKLAHDLSEYHPVTLPALPRSQCPHMETVIVGKERHMRAIPCTGKPGAHGWCEQHERVHLLLELGAKLSYPRVEVNEYRVIGAGVACWERYATLATGAWLKNDLPLLKRMLDQQEALTW